MSNLSEILGISEIGIAIESGAEETEDEEWNYIEVKKSSKEIKHPNKLESESYSSHLIMDQEGVKICVDQNSSMLGGKLSGINELKIECFSELDENMASQLNPDAKEFVPLSPQRSTPTNPFTSNINLLDDVIAQSPRKGASMENIPMPPEIEFKNEILRRPHELEETVYTIDNNVDRSYSPASTNGNDSSMYQELNLKEAMQRDEKSEGEYNDETDKLLEDSAEIDRMEGERLEKPFNDDNLMNKSFYEGRDDDYILPNSNNCNDLNKLQILPSSEEAGEDQLNDIYINKENVHTSDVVELQDCHSKNLNNVSLVSTETVFTNSDNYFQLLETTNASNSVSLLSATEELTNNLSNLLIDVSKNNDIQYENDHNLIKQIDQNIPVIGNNKEYSEFKLIENPQSIDLLSLNSTDSKNQPISFSEEVSESSLAVVLPIDNNVEEKKIVESITNAKATIKTSSVALKNKPSGPKANISIAANQSTKKTAALSVGKTQTVKTSIAVKSVASRSVPSSAQRPIVATSKPINIKKTTSTATDDKKPGTVKPTIVPNRKPSTSAPVTAKHESTVAKIIDPKLTNSKTSTRPTTIKSTVAAVKKSGLVAPPKTNPLLRTNMNPHPGPIKKLVIGEILVPPKSKETLDPRNTVVKRDIKSSTSTGYGNKSVTSTTSKTKSTAAKNPIAVRPTKKITNPLKSTSITTHLKNEKSINSNDDIPATKTAGVLDNGTDCEP